MIGSKRFRVTNQVQASGSCFLFEYSLLLFCLEQRQIKLSVYYVMLPIKVTFAVIIVAFVAMYLDAVVWWKVNANLNGFLYNFTSYNIVHYEQHHDLHPRICNSTVTSSA